MDKPVIGITPDVTHVSSPLGTTDRLCVNLDYIQAILHAGGLPLVLPPYQPIHHYLPALDGILLTGGGDIDPRRYAAHTIHSETYGISELRDEFEITLVKQAIEQNLPLLAICRGIQVLNVALGGTLYQHLPDDLPTSLNHQHELHIPFDQPAHQVRIDPRSRLFSIVGTSELMVNSFHHQAVHELAPPLVASATAPDGVIEAVELPKASFVLGVQWHPERRFPHSPTDLALFKAFVEAARVYSRTRSSSTHTPAAT